jgi:hypothetical protein
VEILRIRSKMLNRLTCLPTLGRDFEEILRFLRFLSGFVLGELECLLRDGMGLFLTRV